MPKNRREPDHLVRWYRMRLQACYCFIGSTSGQLLFCGISDNRTVLEMKSNRYVWNMHTLPHVHLPSFPPQSLLSLVRIGHVHVCWAPIGWHGYPRDRSSDNEAHGRQTVYTSVGVRAGEAALPRKDIWKQRVLVCMCTYVCGSVCFMRVSSVAESILVFQAQGYLE